MTIEITEEDRKLAAFEVHDLARQNGRILAGTDLAAFIEIAAERNAFRRHVEGANVRPDPNCSGCHGTGRAIVGWTPPTDQSIERPIEERCSCLSAYRGPARSVAESVARAMQRHG